MHITRGEIAYAQISFGLLILLVSMFICNSCVWICGDTHLSPKQLLEGNDYVLLGEPYSVDTLVNLGPLEYLGDKEHAYIVEYTYKPREILKGDKSVKYIYLWWCVTIRLKDGYNNAPEADSLELIYGDDIRSPDSVIFIYTPNLVSASRIRDLRDWVRGSPPESKWAAATGDSILVARIMASTQLASILEERNRTGQVIYGTEKGYFTNWSFHYNELLYCDCISCPPHFFVSRSDFVESLRSLSR